MSAASRSAKIAPLWSVRSESEHINSFGAFIKFLREREGIISPRDVSSTFPIYFEEHKAPMFLLNHDMYRKMEKGVRAPQYEELLPLYAALLGCGCKISLAECSTFVRLARLKIETLQRRRPPLRPAGEWRMLEISLAQLGPHAGPEAIQVLEKQIRPRSLVSFDTSHIVGRETWLSQMLTHLAESMKVVVIRGMMGQGKTSGLKLLFQNLQEQNLFYPILYTFSPAGDMTPADHLQSFLSTILAELNGDAPEATKTIPLATQIEQVLTQIGAAAQRVILLVDDAQGILGEQNQLTPEWEQFLDTFLAADHQGALYIAAREWPLWMGRNRSFLIDGDDAALPPLDEAAGIQIWQRQGFRDVPVSLLEQAARRCGYNPLMMELRAASLARPRFSFGLGFRRQKEDTRASQKSEHQRLIERMLDEDQVFTTADVEAARLLTQVVSRRLSHDALQLLEVLSASPLALPFPLLAEVNEAEYGFVDLLNASLLDMNTNDRAALQPLAREAGLLQQRADKRVEAVEELLTRLYQVWLNEGTFLSEQEQAALVSELAVLYLKQHQLLQAAELLVEFGWLALTFGHAARVARQAESVMRAFNWRAKAEDEAGGLLLQFDLLARFLDKDLGNAARKKAYFDLYEVVLFGSVAFQARTVVHLTHHKLRYLVGAKQYAEAWAIIDEACSKYQHAQDTKHITYVELLDQRAYVLGRWGDYQDALIKKDPEGGLANEQRAEALRLWLEAGDVHQQCVELLLQHERFASPIQQSRIRFRRARLLNDLSYYRRCAGRLDEAKLAMEECLGLKEAGYTGKNSLAVSYGDYGQLLGQLGYYREALAYSKRALPIVQQLIDDGDNSVVKQKGMLLIEKGKLLVLLGLLDEAKALFLEGSRLVVGTARDVYKEHAEEGLRQIEIWETQNPRHQLDWRWYPRYHELVLYDDIAWLAQAGPFEEEEQAEWELLIPRRGEPAVDSRLSDLLVQSRRREIAASLAEPRKNEKDQEPRFNCPLIPLQEVQSRRAGLEQLRAEIEQQEQNIVVCRLYTKTIDERLAELRLVEAVYRGDDQEVWVQSKRLAAPATMQELQIALYLLFQRIEQGQKHIQAQPFSESLLQMLKDWQLLSFAQSFESDTCTQKAMKGAGQFEGNPAEAQTWFEPQTVQAFFEEILRSYQFPWSVLMDAAATSARVDLDKGRLILPGKPMTSAKIRELLAHEVEVHAFRSVSGAQSSLALLSSGLGDYLATEEGLASLYVRETVQRSTGAEAKPKIWIGTLACGLAAGIACSPLSFRELLIFIEQVSLLVDLLDGKELTPQLLEKARRYAENRCLRTFRGITHLENRGRCSNKDTYYLQGFLAVCRELEKDPTVFERLMVGSVGLQHLADLAELGIGSPGVTHKRLATDPDLERHIEQFAIRKP